MTRPRGRLTGANGLDALRDELVRFHSEPASFDGSLSLPRGSLGNVIPLRAEPALPETEVEPEPAVVELVAKAQAGDAEAFGQLYDRYLDLVYRYVYYRVGSKA